MDSINCLGIIKFSMEIENWIEIYRLKSIGNPPFKPLRHMHHVVFMGNPSFVQLESTLKELSHDDHFMSAGGNCNLHAVILGERSNRFTKGLIAKLKANVESSRYLTYVAGSPTNAADLDRACVKDAAAAFFLPDKTAQDPNEEDYRTILNLLSTKRHVGQHFRCLVMLLRADNMRHALAAGVHRDDIICEDTVKMGLLAQSSQSPGCSTMISNMAACLSFKAAEEGGNATRIQKIKQTIKQKTRRRLNQPDEQDQPTANWKREYLDGAARELYVVVLSKPYMELTFAAAARKAFTESNVSVYLDFANDILMRSFRAMSSWWLVKWV